MTAQAINTALAGTQPATGTSGTSGRATSSDANSWNDAMQQAHARHQPRTAAGDASPRQDNSVGQNAGHAHGPAHPDSTQPPSGGQSGPEDGPTQNSASSPDPQQADVKAQGHKTGQTHASGQPSAQGKARSADRHHKPTPANTDAAAAVAITPTPTPPADPSSIADNGTAHGDTRQPQASHKATKARTVAAPGAQPHQSSRTTGPTDTPSPQSKPTPAITASGKASQPASGSGKLDPAATTGASDQNARRAAVAAAPPAASQRIAADGHDATRRDATRSSKTTRPTASVNPVTSQNASGKGGPARIAQVDRTQAERAGDKSGDNPPHIGTYTARAARNRGNASANSNTNLGPAMNHTMAAGLNASSGAASAGTGASATNGTAPSALTPQSVAQLNAQIHSLHQAGGGSTQISLHPASLGAIQIQVQMQGTHQAQVTFHAAQTATAQAIQASLPQLATSMQQQGIQLSQPQVNAGGDAGAGQTPGNGQQPGQHANGQSSQGQQQHSPSRQPMTALAAGEVGRPTAPDEAAHTSRPGVRAYA